MAKKCKRCGKTLQAIRLGEVQGADGPITVRILDYPVLSCPEHHEHRHLDSLPTLVRKFSASIEPALTRKTGLPLLRRHVCCNCQRSLDTATEQPDTVGLTVDLPNHPGITLEYSGPALQCPFCRTTQIRNTSEHVMSIARALTAAWGEEDDSRATPFAWLDV